jgi:hypothetical protein
MTTIVFGDVRTRTAPPRGSLRQALARLIVSQDGSAPRQVSALLAGLDGATFAALGYDRSAVEHAGRGALPL